jgi:hypothetical protein
MDGWFRSCLLACKVGGIQVLQMLIETRRSGGGASGENVTLEEGDETRNGCGW